MQIHSSLCPAFLVHLSLQEPSKDLSLREQFLLQICISGEFWQKHTPECPAFKLHFPKQPSLDSDFKLHSLLHLWSSSLPEHRQGLLYSL